MRLFGDGTHGHAEPIQTFRGPACHTTFTARRHTPLYRLKTPSRQVAVVLTALAEGLDPSAAERVFGFRQATITTWLSRALEHAQTLHERSHLATSGSRTFSWTNCGQGSAAPHRCFGCGWPSIPAPSFFPCSIWVLARKTWHIGLSTPCDSSWPPFCLPLFTSDGLNLYFYAPLSPFWPVARRKLWRAESTPVASGGGPDIWPGEKKLPAAQDSAGHARDASWDRSRSQGREASDWVSLDA
jgi:hypothetical protein